MEALWSKTLDLLAGEINQQARHLTGTDLFAAVGLFAQVIRRHNLIDDEGDIAPYLMQEHGVGEGLTDDVASIYHAVDALVTGTGLDELWLGELP